MNVKANTKTLDYDTLGHMTEIDMSSGWAGMIPDSHEPAARVNGAGYDLSDHFDFLRGNQLQFLDALPFGYIALNDKGMIKQANLKTAEMLGVKKDGLTQFNFFQFVQNGDQSKLNVIPSGFTESDGAPFDIQLANGKNSFWARITPIAADRVLVPGEQFEFVFYDIDVSKRLEDENAALKQKIQQTQKHEAIGELSSGIAHDFNNILHPMIGMLELLIEDSDADKKLQKNLETILKGASRATRLVKQILSFPDQSDLDVNPVKVQAIIREVLKLSRSTLPSTIKIVQTIDNGCGPVNADSTHIYQIAMNLVTNAFHAMGHEGGTLYVNVKEVDFNVSIPEHLSLPPGMYVCLGIQDTGKGIDPLIMDKIFEPYFTTKENGSGTGLGLSCIADIIKNYGGDIHCDSQVGKGSLFEVFFPKNQGIFNTNPFKVKTQTDHQ